MWRIVRPLRSANASRPDLVARIDEHGLAGLLAAHDKPVLEEGTDGLTLNYHGQS
jgi:hypothetical protein